MSQECFFPDQFHARESSVSESTSYDQKIIIWVKWIWHHLNNACILIVLLGLRVNTACHLICYGNNVTLRVAEPEPSGQLSGHLKSRPVGVWSANEYKIHILDKGKVGTGRECGSYTHWRTRRQ